MLLEPTRGGFAPPFHQVPLLFLHHISQLFLTGHAPSPTKLAPALCPPWSVTLCTWLTLPAFRCPASRVRDECLQMPYVRRRGPVAGGEGMREDKKQCKGTHSFPWSFAQWLLSGCTPLATGDIVGGPFGAAGRRSVHQREGEDRVCPLSRRAFLIG